MAEIMLNDSNFETEVLHSDKPVLVDFWATWCEPCKMIAPVVAKVAELYESKLKVGKVDVDENRELALEYSISTIPTLLLFRDGKVINKMVGFASPGEVKEFLSDVI